MMLFILCLCWLKHWRFSVNSCKGLSLSISLTHEIKPTQKNGPELRDIYVSFIYISISFYRQHLKIVYVSTFESYTVTLLPLTLTTSLNRNHMNIFNLTLNVGSLPSSLSNLFWNFCLWNFKSQLHISILQNNIIFFLIVMILERFFEYCTRKLNLLLEFQQANFVRYLLHH